VAQLNELNAYRKQIDDYRETDLAVLPRQRALWSRPMGLLRTAAPMPEITIC